MSHLQTAEGVGLFAALAVNATALYLLQSKVSMCYENGVQVLEQVHQSSITRLDLAAEIFLKSINKYSDFDVILETVFIEMLYKEVQYIKLKRSIPLVYNTADTEFRKQTKWLDMFRQQEPTIGKMLMHIMSDDKIFSENNRRIAEEYWLQYFMFYDRGSGKRVHEP